MSAAHVYRPADVARIVGSRRQLLVGGLMLAAGGLVYVRRPTAELSYLGKAKLETLVPKTLGDWKYETTSGLVLPPADELRDRLYTQLLTRVYTRGDTAAMLLIAYSGAQDGMIQVHRPEVCYPASGYELTENHAYQVPLDHRVSIPARFIVARSEARDEQLAYWTRIGDRFPTRWAEQRLAVAEQNLEGLIPDGVLVRISVAGDQVARPLIESFCQALFAGVSRQMRQVLVGSLG